MNKSKLFSIIEMPTPKLISYLNENVSKVHYDIHTDNDNYIFAVPKGDTNHIMLVSHMDTVKRPKNVVIEERNGIISNANGVLGADDRAGVFAILEIAEKCAQDNGPMPYLLFTNYEEVGGVGANVFAKANFAKAYWSDIWLMVELDRRGANDAVYYDEPEKSLKKIVDSLGYKEAHGSFSDVSVLSSYNEIAHVNLSVGYFHEHSSFEILVLSLVEAAIFNVLDLMKLITRPYAIDYTACGSGGSFWWSDSSYLGKSRSKKDKGKKGGIVTVLPKKNPPLLSAQAEIIEEEEFFDGLYCEACGEYCDEPIRFPGSDGGYCSDCGAYINAEYVPIEEEEEEEFLNDMGAHVVNQ